MTGKTIRFSQVIDIVTPAVHPMLLDPHVSLNDSLTHAIEVMVKNNLEAVAVMQNTQVVGVVKLADALRKIGLCR